MGKDAYYFSHDCNADIDPKMVSMMLEYKATGYGWYFIILSAMREQENYKLLLDKNIFKYLSRRCYTNAKKIEKFIQDCVETFKLFQISENFLFSSSFLERMEMKEKKSKSYSERGKKGMATRWSDDNLAITNGNNKRKVKESKGKENNTIKGEFFTKPSLEEINAYCTERKNDVSAQKFFDFYESKGWMVGKNKMKDWKAAVRNWEKPKEKVEEKPYNAYQ